MTSPQKRSLTGRHEAASTADDSETEFLALNAKRVRRSANPSPCPDVGRTLQVQQWLLGSTPESSPAPDSPILRLLREIFKLNDFRAGQDEAVHAAIEGRDVILRLPTGAGKTVAVLLPALHSKAGVTILVVPLVALLRQQTRKILMMSIPIVMFYGGQAQEQNQFSKFLLGQKLNTSHYPLPPFVIMTPEQMVTNEMRSILGHLYSKEMIARFVIDEAQCLFNWANFRHAYNEIKKDLVERYPETPKSFVGATLTDAQIEELSSSVCRESGEHTARILQPLDRPNLYYEVRFCEMRRRDESAKDALLEFVCAEVQSMSGTETGIVYCALKEACDDIVKALEGKNVTAAAYYGSGSTFSDGDAGKFAISSEDQTQRARLWQAGSVRVIVATSAFGMGIDKPDVRFVAHLGPPKALDEWYQDSGRGGRDGRPAKCVIFYGTGNFHTHADQNMRDVIRQFGESTAMYSGGQPLKAEVLQSLRDMHRACLESITGLCLRRALLAPFGQGSIDDCGNCSACRLKQPVETVDITAWAQNALAALESIAGDSQRTLRACKTDLAHLLHGSKGEAFKERTLPYHGTGRKLEGVPDLGQRKVALLLDVLQVYGVFTLSFKIRAVKRPGQPDHYSVWKPGPRADAVKFGAETVFCARSLLL
ncbi:ATP-dependent DNA helicase [Auricularia subglabra TFB-10046 SS5]|nr:ATP-dependent DNA helicase [Auricularia subglabra TFB-10046 SS5]